MKRGQQSSGFVPFIHILRGLASLIVAWSHLAGWWIYVHGIEWLPYKFYYDKMMLPFHLYESGGQLGVVVFFLISGYVISMVGDRERTAEFVIKRLFRILPPLLLAACVMAALNETLKVSGHDFILGTVEHSGRAYLLAGTLLDHFWFQQDFGMPVTWTLVPEVVFYSMFALMLPSIQKSPIGGSWLLLGLFMLWHMPMITNPWMNYISGHSNYLPIFLIGRVFYLHGTGQGDSKNHVLLIFASVLLYLALNEARFPGMLLNGPIRKVFTMPLAIVVFAALMFSGIRRVPPVLDFFGHISYSMYLLHIPVGMTMLILLSEPIGYSFAFVIACVMVFFASWLSYRYCERPTQRLARRVIGAIRTRFAMK